MLQAADTTYCGSFPEVPSATVGDLANLSAAAVKTLRQVAKDSHSTIEAAGAAAMADQWRELWDPWDGHPHSAKAADVLPPVALEEICRLTGALVEFIRTVSPWAQTGAVYGAYAEFVEALRRMRARRAGTLPSSASSVLPWLAALALLGATGFVAWRYRKHIFPGRAAFSVNP